MAFEYPLTGFHFVATFELFPQNPVDVRFQEVSGISVTMNTETYTEGGENRFVHKLPTRSSYSDITLKRGLFTQSVLYEWCRRAMEDYEFQPVNILIAMLNESHVPVFAWHVIHAIPTKWEISSLSAEKSEVVIESLVLSYSYFKTVVGGLNVPSF